MIEATCSACGTLNRIAESDVPMGAKFVACSSCKSRVVLPAKTAAGPAKVGIPAIPKLPPPVPKGPPSIPLGPAGAGSIPVVPPSLGNNNDIIDLSDLPAPKRQSGLAAAAAEPARPVPRSGLAAALDADLPAPKAKTPSVTPLALDDLLPPAGPRDIVDLPAPNARDTPEPKIANKLPSTDAELPAPKPRPANRPTTPPSGQPGITDLLAPKGGHQEIVDLPAPKGPSGSVDLPTPARPDLLQPLPGQVAKGAGIVDLPVPKPGAQQGSVDLPAPKGFFDDLPQPARGQKPGPAQTYDVAPKGFFDDLPQPARGQRSGPAQTYDVAPKGFFDDLPQPARQKPGPAPTDDVAPKGLFDDLPQPAAAGRQHDDRGAIDLGDEPIPSIDLADEPALALDRLQQTPAASGGSFDDLDLSAPSAGPGARITGQQRSIEKSGDDDGSSAIRFQAKGKSSGASAEKSTLPSFARPDADAPLELEEPRKTESIGQRLSAKPQRAAVSDSGPTPSEKAKHRKIVMGVVLALAVAGGGGFFAYRHFAAKAAAEAQLEEQLESARKALRADDIHRWTRAHGFATAVLASDGGNAAAAGIAAEAQIAGALADGKNIVARFAKGRQLIAQALERGASSPELERAQALSMLTTSPDKAAPKLQALAAKAPKDGTLALYVAWAYSAAGNIEAAIKAYDAAAALPSATLLATLGRARAKLDHGDLEGARTDFNAVLALPKQNDNIAAQVGLAASLPASQLQQQETDLLAILARTDIKNADPRAVTLAYTLAGNAARRSNRYDAARERYRKALALDASYFAASVGSAEVDLADNKLQSAADVIDKVLVRAKDDVAALIVKAEITLKQNKLELADELVKALEERQPPPPTLQQIRIKMLRGNLLDARKQDDAALEAYEAAAKLAGDLDLAPTIAAIAKLSELAKAAADATDTAKEQALKGRADTLLSTKAAAAEKDPALAYTLGISYVQAGDPAKAEPWLRRVAVARPKDPDALYQLGKVLRALARNEEALEQIKLAVAAAPDRVEIALELARTYEGLKNDAEAIKAYAKLLENPDVPLEVRGHAGRFFVRTGQLDKAKEQGEVIVKADRDLAVGHYLLGEGLLHGGQLEDARRELTEAVMLERTAQHLDAQARAHESISINKKELASQDSAIRAYQAAIELDPKMVSSHVGLGRLFVARNEMAKAIAPLQAASALRKDDAEIAYLFGAANQKLGTPAHKKAAIGWLVISNRLKSSADTSNKLGELYSDPDINDPGKAVAAFGTATKLAIEDAKRTGAQVPKWYADALYRLGDLAQTLGNDGVARAAWEKWIGTNPTSGVRRTTVERALATSLRRN